MEHPAPPLAAAEAAPPRYAGGFVRAPPLAHTGYSAWRAPQIVIDRDTTVMMMNGGQFFWRALHFERPLLAEVNPREGWERLVRGCKH